MQIKDEYKNSPFVLWLDKPYAIGGDVKLNDSPPKLGRTISECTDKEYEYLYNLGYTRFFQLETAKVKGNKKQDKAVKDESELNNEGVGLENDTTATTDEG